MLRAWVHVHLLFSASDWQNSWKMRLVFPLPTGPPVLLPPAGSMGGGHGASSGCGKYKYKYKCVHVCMHTSETIIIFFNVLMGRTSQTWKLFVWFLYNHSILQHY